jgi:salicylate hydroxylase
MQVIASFFTGKKEPEVFGKAWAEVSKEFWTSRLKGYGWIGEKISQVIENKEKVYASCYRRHDETPVYSKRLLCLAGDASGSFSPALGAGASQAIEDALILSTVLGCVSRTQDLERAFQVYESIRHPRRNRVAMESNKQGLKITGNMEGVGTDREKLAQAVQEPYDFLFNFDLKESVSEARRMMGKP